MLSRLRSKLLLLAFCFLFATLDTQAQAASSAGSTIDADSTNVLQAQFAEILRAARSHNQEALKAAIDSFRIPNSDQWFAAHFDPRFLPQLPQEYSKAFSTYQSHVAWVMENYAKFDDFGLKVEASESPLPIAESGIESLLPRPVEPVPIKNFRISSTVSDPKHGPRSWVSSFALIDGNFRFVGGTYPFWAEKLTAWRGPMSLPPATIHGMTVQGIAFQKDFTGPGIAAIVQLKVDIARDGRASHVKVLAGKVAFIQDAKDYVQAANFGALPDMPQLANARREWDIAVVFFEPKN